MVDEATLDHLAFSFRQLAVKQCSLEVLARQADMKISAELEELAFRNAMMIRGVLVEHGMCKVYEGHDFKDTIPTAFRKFSARAVEIVEMEDAPVPAAELIARIGMSEGAMPLGALRRNLQRVGLNFIPGLGYWHKKHFIDAAGTIYGKQPGSKRREAMLAAFQSYGWPLTNVDIQAATRGYVSRHYVVMTAKQPYPDILSIGYGLYVPAGAAKRAGVPMSKNIARAFLELDPGEAIDAKDNTRMYRMCKLLHEMGYGLARYSNTRLDNKQRRIAYFTVNKTGRRRLKDVVGRKKPADEF